MEIQEKWITRNSLSFAAQAKYAPYSGIAYFFIKRSGLSFLTM